MRMSIESFSTDFRHIESKNDSQKTIGSHSSEVGLIKPVE